VIELAAGLDLAVGSFLGHDGVIMEVGAGLVYCGVHFQGVTTLLIRVKWLLRRWSLHELFIVIQCGRVDTCTSHRLLPIYTLTDGKQNKSESCTIFFYLLFCHFGSISSC
jgi:hypothetical protein